MGVWLLKPFKLCGLGALAALREILSAPAKVGRAGKCRSLFLPNRDFFCNRQPSYWTFNCFLGAKAGEPGNHARPDCAIRLSLSVVATANQPLFILAFL
jgi:hypothetical protein